MQIVVLYIQGRRSGLSTSDGRERCIYVHRCSCVYAYVCYVCMLVLTLDVLSILRSFSCTKMARRI